LISHVLERTPGCLGRAMVIAGGIAILASSCRADGPFFVTYTTQMAETGELEVENRSVGGHPSGVNLFGATALEFEYGATRWWTTEFYLDGQTTQNENTVFTGYRFENRFHVFKKEHWLNPVLYTEFEHLNEADKTMLEIFGHDVISDLAAPTAEARHQRNWELETKLILDSHFKGWTLAENLMAEKNLGGGPWEFGYTIGISRPLVRRAAPGNCAFCAGSLIAGVEVYGGVGTIDNFGLQQTSHYVGPVFLWSPAHGTAFKVSPNFGLTGASATFLLRVGFAFEVDDFGRRVQSLFGRPF